MKIKLYFLWQALKVTVVALFLEASVLVLIYTLYIDTKKMSTSSTGGPRIEMWLVYLIVLAVGAAILTLLYYATAYLHWGWSPTRSVHEFTTRFKRILHRKG